MVPIDRQASSGSSQLTASIPASDIASGRIRRGHRLQSCPRGRHLERSRLLRSITRPRTLGSINPTSATAGGAGFTLTVSGSNFVSGAVVRWNGADRTTTSAAATQLTAAIPASDIAAGGTASVTVVNPGPGGGVSNAATFTINNPVPVLASINPTSAITGGPAFTLTVTGSNFVSGSVVRWNGADRPTSGSGTQLTAAIPATDIAAGGTASITVVNPGPGGGASSAASFTINNPVPVLASINPTSAITGGAAFTLTVTRLEFRQWIRRSLERSRSADHGQRQSTYGSDTSERHRRGWHGQHHGLQPGSGGRDFKRSELYHQQYSTSHLRSQPEPL